MAMKIKFIIYAPGKPKLWLLPLAFQLSWVDPGMSLNCAPTRVCRKSASRPGYVVKVRTDPGYVVKQCPRIVMNKIFVWH